MSELERLTSTRSAAVERLAQSAREQRFTGLTGEADVGKSAILAAALAQLDPRAWAIVQLDLDAAWSPNRLAWRWARELARAVTAPAFLSHIESLDQSMWPAATRQQLLRLPAELGEEVARLVEAPQPERGVGKADALDAPAQAMLAVAEHTPTLLVVDHLEAPKAAGLSSPNAGQLLWRVRAGGQYRDTFHVLVCARPPAQELASGPEAAYHMDGRWLTLEPPTPADFSHATGAQLGVSAAVVARTGGHPRATIEILDELPRSRPASPAEIDQVIGRVASRHIDLARRYMQHARSVHRLGGHLLNAVAQGRGPYEATPEIDGSEVSQAMTRLHLNGLVRRTGPREWAPADPRVAWTLGGAIYQPVRKPSRGGRRPTTAASQEPVADDLARQPDFASLTRAQRGILDRLAHGYSNAEIADDLGISVSTVKTHLSAIYEKLGVAGRGEAREAAAKTGSAEN